MPWWTENRMRMVQFNLVATNAAADTDRLVEQLKGFHANALMTGAGGIVAYYPSKLPYAYVSPYMGEKDMLGDLVKKCHESGMRVIGRFDFSKIHESIAEKHPEWLFRRADGEAVNYNTMVHTCICGEYQGELCLEILRECLTQYPVDGVYFNMFGFRTVDYSGVDHGICQCESCKRKYKEITGFDLPLDGNDPHIEDYYAFQKTIVAGVLERVHALIKSINPEISICTHGSYDYVDMIHTESNYTLRLRKKPFALYSSTDNCRMTNDSYPDIYAANCVINAADIAWRFMGVSTYLNEARLWQNIGAGSQPEWCIVGIPDDYPETENYDGVREVFAF
ncbi:family 10 glycosylhydrolase, partial [Eubacteriales bacterium OttesenSCG-928-A19]|nr:family 10 glycosylhydrolase [Eubacteriales bacterium OttesenSCG-928-A19]